MSPPRDGRASAAELVAGYARAGLAVLPLHAAPDGVCTCGDTSCPSPGKHPRLRHGAKDASTDPGVIAEWLARWPACNWGGCPPNGAVVLDVDPRNGGDASLAGLTSQHGPLPDTLTAQTGSGGWHLWLSYSGPSRGKLAAGLDVKKAGGYVVLPPSVHECGGTYRWTDTRPAAPAPQWVRDLLNPPPPKVSGRVDRPSEARDAGMHRWLEAYVGNAQEGTRNDNLFHGLCIALERGFDPRFLLDLAIGTGLTPTEVGGTYRSAIRHIGDQGRAA